MNTKYLMFEMMENNTLPYNFIADSDPTTTTDPLNPDSDGDTIPDGVEDSHNNDHN